MNIEEYRRNPCRYSSLSWHKSKSFNVSNGIKVFHINEYNSLYKYKIIDKYFKMSHNLKKINDYKLSSILTLRKIDINSEIELEKISEMVIKSYTDERLPLNQIKDMINSPYFDRELWKVIVDESDNFIGSCIAEIDKEVPEGIIDWIQVLPKYQNQGLGKVLINSTLEYMKDKVEFAIVSGRIDNETNPLELYKACGFIGDDVWIIVNTN